MLKRIGMAGVLLSAVLLVGCSPPSRNVANATAAGAVSVITVASLDKTKDPVARKAAILEIVVGVRKAIEPSGTAGDLLSISVLRNKIINDICPKGYEIYAQRILAVISAQSLRADRLSPADIRGINWILDNVETSLHWWHADSSKPIER